MSPAVSRWFIKSGALWVAAQLVPGIQVPDSLARMAAALALFGVLTIVLRLLLFPFLLFALWSVLVVDVLALWLTAVLAGWMAVDFVVEGFVPALLGAVVVNVVGALSQWCVRRTVERRRIRRMETWMLELERATAWLDEQRGNWQRLAEQRRLIIKEQEAWIGELENATAWLKEQGGNWRRLAQERAQAIRKQGPWIRQLERANARLERQRRDRPPAAERIREGVEM